MAEGKQWNRDHGRAPDLVKHLYDERYGTYIRTTAFCPECSCVVQRDDNYEPRYCSYCGQKLDWREVMRNG